MFIIPIDHDLARLIGLDVPDLLSGLTDDDDDGPGEGFVGPNEGCTAQSTEPEKGVRVFLYPSDSVFVKDGYHIMVNEGVLGVTTEDGRTTLALFAPGGWSHTVKVG